MPNLDQAQLAQIVKAQQAKINEVNATRSLSALNDWCKKKVIENVIREADGDNLDKPLTQTMVVSLGNKTDTTMFGKTIKKFLFNPLADPNLKERMEYRLHPYEKQGTGVSVTLCYFYKGVLHFVLIKKKNASQLDQAGGYTKGHWLEGGNRKVDLRDDDAIDATEEALIGNANAITLTDRSKQRKSIEVNYTLLQAKEAVTAIYCEMLKQNSSFDFDIDPRVMKEKLAQRGVHMETQFNALETAMDEVFQELGLDLKTSKHKIHYVFTADDFAISNEDPRLHNRVTHFAVCLGEPSAHPVWQPGSDIAEAINVPISQIMPAFTQSAEQDCSMYDGMPIRRDYGTVTLTRVAKTIHNHLIKENSNINNNALFSETENVIAHLNLALAQFKLTAEDLLGKRPVNYFGAEASIYYAKLYYIANDLKQHLFAFNNNYLERLQLGLKNIQEELEEALKIIVNEKKESNAATVKLKL